MIVHTRKCSFILRARTEREKHFNNQIINHGGNAKVKRQRDDEEVERVMFKGRTATQEQAEKS